MAALSASVAAESAAVKSALVEAPRSPVKFTTHPVPAFIARDEEEHAGQEEEDFLEAAPSPAAVTTVTTGDPAPTLSPSSASPVARSPSIEEIAPNAAKLIATPGSEKETSPLSVFARMMAKVIRDTEEELTKSAVKARATELMASEEERVVDDAEVLAGEMPSPPKSAASLPSPAARTPTTGPVAGLSPVDAGLSDKTPEAVPEASGSIDDADVDDVETPPTTLPSPMGSVKGSPAVRVPVGHPAHPGAASTGLTPALARLGIGSSAAPATPTETDDDDGDGDEDDATPLGVVMTGARVTRGSVGTGARRVGIRSVDRLHAGVAPRVAGTPASAKRGGGTGTGTGTGTGGKKKPPTTPAGSAGRTGGGGARGSKKSSLGAAAAAAAAGATPGSVPRGGLRRSKRLSQGADTPTSARKPWEN